MPMRYGCSSCGIRFSTGSYHGSSGVWCTALYCRECGASIILQQSSQTFLGAFSCGRGDQARSYRYEFIGSVKPHEIVIDPGNNVPPEVECACGAKGPFGPDGPITDQPPEDFQHDSLFGIRRSTTVGICPRCKRQTLRQRGEWIA